jgi:putative pyruvate formate lyase activating enzyme
VAAVCLHRGEEPAISGPGGIANVFFSGCNLHCVYCQNWQISRGGRRR